MSKKTRVRKRSEDKRLVAIDVGNSHVAVGCFRDATLECTWRLRTERRQTADDYRIRIESLLRSAGIGAGEIEGAVMCSVVPPLTGEFLSLARGAFGLEPLNLEPAGQSVLPIAYVTPAEVGADRIANAIAGVRLYGPPLVIVDLGTATTVDVVSEDGVYLGGAIAPGLESSLEALFSAAARLTGVDLRAPGPAIGKTTEEALLSGAIYGHAAAVNGLVARIQGELGGQPTVVGTGGLLPLVAPHVNVLHHLRPHLTLEGLFHFWQACQ